MGENWKAAVHQSEPRTVGICCRNSDMPDGEQLQEIQKFNIIP